MQAYEKTFWSDNEGEPLYAENLNNIENGIEAATEGVTAVEQGKADISHTHPVDSAFSLTSTNPIQNVVVTRKINEIVADANNNFSNVNTQLAGKADKSTTLGGYGIIDAVDLTEYYSDMENIDSKFATVNTQLSGKVDSSVYNQKIGEIEGSLDDIDSQLLQMEDISHKVDVIDHVAATNTQYPSARAVVNYINTILGRGTSQND